MKRKIYTLNKWVSKAKLSLSVLCLGTGLNAIAMTPIEIEAENYDVATAINASKDNRVSFSGGVCVGAMRGIWGSKVSYTNIVVDEAGTYDLTISYATAETRYAYVRVNNQLNSAPIAFESSGDYTGEAGTRDLTVQIYMDAGANTLEVGGYRNWSPNFDKFVIAQSSKVIAKPAEQLAAPITFEAESAFFKKNCTSFNSGDWAANFSGAEGVQPNSEGKLMYKVTAPESGVYDLFVYYTGSNDRTFYVNVKNQKTVHAKIGLSTGSWEGRNDAWNGEPRPGVYRMPVTIYLEAGENTITIAGTTGNFPIFDKFEILKSSNEYIETASTSVFDYTDIATLTESTVTTQDNLNKLIDNNEKTVYTVDGVNQVQITAEMPYPIILTGFAYASQIEEPVSEGWLVEYSDNGSDWTSVPTFTIKTINDGGFWKFITECNPTGGGVVKTQKVLAKYYRLTATGSGSVEIGEWQLYGSPLNFPDGLVDIDITNPEDVSRISYADIGFTGWSEGYANAFSKKSENHYTLGGTMPFYLAYEFPEDTKVTAKSYSLSVPYRDDLVDRDPKSWIFSGCTVAGENWVELDVRKDISFPAYGSTLMFNVENPQECSAYKLTVTKNNGSTAFSHLTEWQMFGESLTMPTSIEGSLSDADELVATKYYNLQGVEVIPTEGNFYIQTKVYKSKKTEVIKIIF